MSVKESAEASEEALGSAGGSASQVDPTSADQAGDQLAAPRAAVELENDGDELQQVCNLGPNPKYASVKDPPTSTKPSLFIERAAKTFTFHHHFCQFMIFTVSI